MFTSPDLAKMPIRLMDRLTNLTIIIIMINSLSKVGVPNSSRLINTNRQMPTEDAKDRKS